jgi:hypothetical protein
LPVLLIRNASCRVVSGEVTPTGLTLCSVTTTLMSSSTTNWVVLESLKVDPGPADQFTVAVFAIEVPAGVPTAHA